MTIDQRTRRYDEIRDLTVEEFLHGWLPGALAAHGDLAARGADVMGVGALGVRVGDAAVTVRVRDGRLVAEPGTDRADLVAELDAAALSRLVQDQQTTMGLAITSDVQITRGTVGDWIRWEPVLRALFDGRAVHEPGAIELRDPDGGPLDVGRSFTLDDDRSEIASFLTEAGFLHLAGVFDPDEMAAVADDLDAALAAASPDDGASWWATDSGGDDVPVRVLWFDERSPTLQGLLADDRLRWLCEVTGDDHLPPRSAEGLIKPLGIARGLSDLPWHKDCGQGQHAYVCSSMTVGISVTGADADSGALGVVPGSHRANTLNSSLDPGLDLVPRKLETATGDVTVHCGDTLHRAHPPRLRPRKVVYTSFALPPLPGDARPADRAGDARRARADLTDATDRIEAADGGATRVRY